MPGNYETFYVMKADENGVMQGVAGVTVTIYDRRPYGRFRNGGDRLERPGRGRVSFRVGNHQGLAGSVTQITT